MSLEEEFEQTELEKSQEFYDLLESIKRYGKWPVILDIKDEDELI